MAVGDDGEIVRSTDGKGESWSAVKDSGTRNWLTHVTAVPGEGGKPPVLVAVGNNGAIVRSTDGQGERWSAVRNSGTRDLLSHVIAVPGEGGKPPVLVAVGNNGAIVRSTDGRGENWSAVKESGTRGWLEHVIVVPGEGGKPPVLVAVGQDGAIVRSTDGQGESWTAVKDSGTRKWLSHVIAVPGEGGKPPVLVAVGNNGAIVRSTDGKGESWSAVVDSGTSSSLSHVVAVSSEGGKPPVLVAVGNNGAIVRSTDGQGESWSAVADSRARSWLNHVIAVSGEGGKASVLVAFGEDGTIVRSTDGKGESWSAVKVSGTSSFLSHVVAVPGEGGKAAVLVAVGSDGAIVRSTDGKGESWSAVKDSGTRKWLRQVIAAPSDGGKPSVLVAIGADGAIVRSTDGKGENWSLVNDSGIRRQLNHLIAVPGEGGTAPVLVAVGDNGAIVRSTDGKGESWSAVKDSRTSSSLSHVIAVPGEGGKPPALVAVGIGGVIVRSTDGKGESWSAVQDSGTSSSLSHVIAVPAEGGKPPALVAVGIGGVIVRSTDGKGESWSAVQDSGTSSSLNHVIAVPGQGGKPPVLVAVGQGGAIVRSTDGKGENWSAVKESGTRGWLEHVIAVPGEGGKLPVLVAVGADGAIVRSTDGQGESWSAVKDSGTRMKLNHVIAMPGEGSTAPVLVAVGEDGTIIRSYSIEVPRLVRARASYDFPSNHPKLTLDIRPQLEGDCTNLSCVSIGVVNHSDLPIYRKTRNKQLERSAPSQAWRTGGAGSFEIVLDPSTYGARKPDPLYLRVRLSGPGYSFTYPDSDGFFEVPNHPEPLSKWMLGLGITAAFCAALYLLMLLRPLSLLSLASRPVIWQASEVSGIPGLGGFTILVLSKLLMPVLSRQPRVLDAWTARHSATLSAAFETAAESATERRSPYFPLPFSVSGNESVIPSPEAVGRLFAGSRTCIQVLAQGGAGKTRLALQMGRWASEGGVTRHPVAVVFVDQEFDDLLSVVVTKLNAALGDDAISTEFVIALLKSGRLWVIVDRLSERRFATQAAFGRIYEKVWPSVLICTARHLIPVEYTKPLVIRPLSIDKKTLLSFLGDQFQAVGAADFYPTLADQGALVQKLARLITVGNKELPVTPLLVRVFVSQAVELRRRLGQEAIDMLPANVPEAYFSYVERLDATTATAETTEGDSAMRARQAAALVAWVELGEDFRPKPVARSLLVSALGGHAAIAKSGVDYLERMELAGLLVTRKYGGEVLVEFVLDPLAECFAAFEHARRCGSNPQCWADLVSKVSELGDGASGFMQALRMNHAAYGRALGFPVVEFE